MRKRKGFTMVELMVVIIIMAILGLAIMPSLMGSSDRAKYSRAWNDLTAIANAFTAYYGNKGTFPSISATTLEGAFTGTDKDLFQSFLGTPLEKLKDPWDNSYAIKSNWNGSKGHIIVYVTGGTTGSASFGGSGANAATVTARKDPYNGDQPMAKLIINVM